MVQQHEFRYHLRDTAISLELFDLKRISAQQMFRINNMDLELKHLPHVAV